MACSVSVLWLPIRALAQEPLGCPSHALEAALARCEGVERAASPGRDAPRSHLPAARADVSEPSRPPSGRERDLLAAPPARAAGASRSLALLDREIQTLERIVGRLSPADPRGADYLFRLAESHAERQRALSLEARSRDELIFQAERVGDGSRASMLRREQLDAEAALDRAREGAIRAYARLISEYPAFARADEVLYSLAANLEEMGQSERALEVHRRLVREHPESRFVPHAWLAFGEHYFAGDDMEAARQFYERVLELPPDQNPLHGFALYRLAWTHFNLEDFRGALAQFTRVLDFAREHPEAPDVEALARQTRRELVLPYARVGRPPQALAFFRRQARSADEALEMMESLAELYVDTGQWPESIATHRALMAEAPRSHHLCRWQAQVTGAVVASRPKPDQVTEIERLIDVERLFVAATHPAPDVLACRTTAAQMAYETAVAWHREAVGTEDQPGTRDRRTMALAERLYSLAIDAIPELDTLEFPALAREDWPTRARVAYARAELSFAMEDWRGCGPAFDRVVELATDASLSADAAYGAAFCYDRVYQLEHAVDTERLDASSLAARESTELEERMLAAFQRFACVAPDSDDLPQVQYRRARVYYESNRFEEAAILFRGVAFDHADHELAEPAANLYLDSLNGLLRRDGREPCRDRIATDLEPLGGSFCGTAAARDAHPELCEVVAEVRCGLLRQDAQALGASGRHREAAAAYVEIFRHHGECGQLDEVLYDAAIHYEAARLLGRAIRVRRVLLDRFPDRPLARPALHQLGANYHALAIYGPAATHYEQYARRFPDEAACPGTGGTSVPCPSAPEALENAVFFRLGLGDDEQALEDARLYERNYRRSRPRETADVVFSLGSIHERRGDWARVGAHHHAFLRDHGRSARPDQVLRAHVQQGRAEWEEARRDRAAPHFRAAEQAWSRLSQADLAALPQAQRALVSARVAEAASEALFYLAEGHFAEFRSVRFPRYRGPSTIVAVNRWSREELAPWLARKLEALHAAESAYVRVEPLGIPEWRIASAERVGEMYRDIIDDVRSAPVPEEIASDDTLLDLYEGVRESLLNGSHPGPDGAWETSDDVACPDATSVDLGQTLSDDESSVPASCRGAPIARAMAAFEHCLSLATEVRWFNTWSTRCESALNEMNPRRYPLAAELRGTATFSGEGLARPGATEATEVEPAEAEEEEDATELAPGAA